MYTMSYPGGEADRQLQRTALLDDVSLRPEYAVFCTNEPTNKAKVVALSRSNGTRIGRLAVCQTRFRRDFVVGTVCLTVCLLSGCTGHRRETTPVAIKNLRFSGLTIAVAPAVNLSGSSAFDAERFADLMASELHYTEHVSVIPVSRVLAVLASQGRRSVESPDHALVIAEVLNADAILVFAVTEYDPYDPPSIGITAQLYGAGDRKSGQPLDSANAAPDADRRLESVSNPQNRLLAQTQRVFHATHESTTDEIRDYAAQRDGGRSPYGWKRFVVSQQDFIRYCCYSTIRSLVTQ